MRKQKKRSQLLLQDRSIKRGGELRENSLFAGAPPAQPVARRCGTGDLPRRSKAPEENPRDLEKKKWKRNEKEVGMRGGTPFFFLEFLHQTGTSDTSL